MLEIVGSLAEAIGSMHTSVVWLVAGWLCTLATAACLSTDPIGSGPAPTACGAITCSEQFLCVTTVPASGVADNRCVPRGGCDICECRERGGCAALETIGAFTCTDRNGTLAVACTQ